MSTRTKIIIVLVIFIIIGAIFTIWKINQRPPVASNPSPAPIDLSTNTAASPVSPQNSQVKTTGATEPTSLRLGTPKGVVTVNNFRKLIVSSDEGIDVFKETKNYALAYENNSQRFRINFPTGSVGGAEQQSAERDLMDVLGINQENACKLPIIITSTAPASPTLATWSFCPPGV